MKLLQFSLATCMLTMLHNHNFCSDQESNAINETKPAVVKEVHDGTLHFWGSAKDTFAHLKNGDTYGTIKYNLGFDEKTPERWNSFAKSVADSNDAKILLNAEENRTWKFKRETQNHLHYIANQATFTAIEKRIPDICECKFYKLEAKDENRLLMIKEIALIDNQVRANKNTFKTLNKQAQVFAKKIVLEYQQRQKENDRLVKRYNNLIEQKDNMLKALATLRTQRLNNNDKNIDTLEKLRQNVVTLEELHNQTSYLLSEDTIEEKVFYHEAITQHNHKIAIEHIANQKIKRDTRLQKIKTELEKIKLEKI